MRQLQWLSLGRASPVVSARRMVLDPGSAMPSNFVTATTTLTNRRSTHPPPSTKRRLIGGGNPPDLLTE